MKNTYEQKRDELTAERTAAAVESAPWSQIEFLVSCCEAKGRSLENTHCQIARDHGYYVADHWLSQQVR